MWGLQNTKGKRKILDAIWKGEGGNDKFQRTME